MPCKTATTATGPSCATPKPVGGGPCGQPSAWMRPTVSQDTTQSLWDPTLGSPGHPGSGKIQLVKFSPFLAKFALQNCQNRHGTILCDPKTRLQAIKCLDASYSVPRRHTISMGPYHGVPQAPWVRQNRKNREFHPFRGPRKKTSQKPRKPPKSQKNRNSAKMRLFHQTFLLRTIWPIYSG